jgi:catechol 2,3-dioxygenase-like lactoylglutathione lyase family enzyme
MKRDITRKSSKPPLLKVKFLSHGTLECKDLQSTRRFYEEVLGLEVIQHLPGAMMIRLGSNHTYAVVQTARTREMDLLNHNGLDVGSEEEVREAYEILQSVQQEYGIRKLQKPHLQHGAYSFYVQDLDGNWWEILANPPGGYSVKFDDPAIDLTGRPAEDESQENAPR